MSTKTTTRRNGKRAEAVPEAQPAIRIRIDRSKLKNRDLLLLDRASRDPKAVPYEDVLNLLARSVIDATGEPVDPDIGWDMLLELTEAETMAALSGMVAGAQDDAVPPTNGAPSKPSSTGGRRRSG